MDFIHDRSSNIIFSMHDSKVQSINFENETLTLTVDRIFQYTEDEEKMYPARIVFEGCDIEECDVYVFDRTLGKGDFSGKSIELQEYIDNYSHVEFEILTEGYFGYCTTYIGWIWDGEKEPVSAIMNIWNTGDMIYKVDEESKHV